MVVEKEKQEELDFDRILLNATTMANALEYYLIEGNVFRIVMVRRLQGLERMTMSVGELFTLLHTLQAMRFALTSEQNCRLNKMLTSVEQTSTQLRVRLQEMIVREIMSRLDHINWFLHDCENGKEGHQVAFSTEISNRQRIEELVKFLSDEMTDSVVRRIERIDQRIRLITHKSDFIWPIEVQSIYPEDSYWYLYSLPNSHII